MHAAVVFPHAHHRAGVERVAWELADHLGRRHQVTFVGRSLAPGSTAAFARVVCPPGPVAFRLAAGRALRRLAPDVTVTMGAECPPGDVRWVHSVHRAYLSRSHPPVVRSLAVPAWTRQLLPRHRTLLALERSYFTSSRPMALLCTSPREQADLATWYGLHRSRLAHPGYDPGTFSADRRTEARPAARARLGLGAGDLSLLFVANELHRKGFATLVEALARADLPSARVDVVGRVDDRDHRTLLARLGLTARVRWHGPTDDVAAYHAAADLLVLPTRYEPFGIVIIEALASGLPVITSRLAGAAGPVESGGAGRLLGDPADVGELVAALREASDPAVRRRWAEAAPAAARPYAWSEVLAGVEEVLIGAATGHPECW